MKKITNFLIKYKVLVILFLIIIVLPAILIPTTYVSKYNKHPLFDLDKIDISDPNDNEYISFLVSATEYTAATYDINGSVTNGNIKLKSEVSGKRKVSNIKYTYLLTSFWDESWESNQSQTTVSITNTLTANTSAITRTNNVPIKKIFPFKPILFVEVEHPTLYVKVEFETDKVVPTDTSTIKHTYYFMYEYDDYITNETTIS